MIRRQALEHWKQTTAAAPAGPWRVEAGARADLFGSGGEPLGELRSGDAGAFIVAAREAMPVLLAELDHLVELVRTIGRAEERQCPDCGPVDALGHKKRCRIAPYLR